MRVAPDVSFPKKAVKGKLRYMTQVEEAALLYELYPLRDRIGLGHPAKRGAVAHARAIDQYDLTVFLLDSGARYARASGTGGLGRSAITLLLSRNNSGSATYTSFERCTLHSP